MNQGTSGTYELLFPRSDTGGDNRVEAGKDYIVPASQGWFKVSGAGGKGRGVVAGEPGRFRQAVSSAAAASRAGCRAAVVIAAALRRYDPQGARGLHRYFGGSEARAAARADVHAG